MKCNNCNSHKIIFYNHNDLNSIIYHKDGNWFFQNPQTSYIYFKSNKPYYKICFDCGESDTFDIQEIKKIISPSLNKKEITLDLDYTLFYHNYYHQDSFENWDIEFQVKDSDKKIKQIARPHLKDFIKFCCERFEKINIFTAAQDWYAEHLINYLNIPKNKLGYIKTFNDTVNKRPITFHREWVKKINNSLVIDDKPHVIEGHGNIVYGIRPFNGEKDDEELIKLMNLIKNKKEVKFKVKDEFNFTIELFLKGIKIKTKKISLDIANKIVSELELVNEEDMKYIRTSNQGYPYFATTKDGDKMVFSDLNYENYIKLLKLIKPFIKDHKEISKKDFNKILENKYSEHKNRFNF